MKTAIWNLQSANHNLQNGHWTLNIPGSPTISYSVADSVSHSIRDWISNSGADSYSNQVSVAVASLILDNV